MPSARYSVALRNNRLQAVIDYAGNASVWEFYAGTQPETGGAETTLLATMTGATPFGTKANGVLTITPPADANASQTGTATWARIYKSDGTTHVMDLSVGVAGSGAQIILNSADLTAGVPVSVLSASITAGNP